MTRLKSRKRMRRTRRKKGGGECNEASIYERLDKSKFFQNLESFKQKLFEGAIDELPASLQSSINDGKVSEKGQKMREFELHLDNMMEGGKAEDINKWHDRAKKDESGYVITERLCSIGPQLSGFMGQFKMNVEYGRDEKTAEGGCCSYKIASSGGRRRRRKSRRKSKKRRKKTKKRRRRRRR